MSYAMMAVNYGTLQKGRTYPVLKDGGDFVAIKVSGKLINVFKSFLERDPISKIYEVDENEEDYEDFINY